MKNMSLNEVKVNDLVRYQFYMNTINYYSKAIKITNAYIILENGSKFRKADGWGVGRKKSYCIEGINDQEACYEDDLANAYYF